MLAEEPIREYRKNLSACLDNWGLPPEQQQQLRVALAEELLETVVALREARGRAAEEHEQAQRGESPSEYNDSWSATCRWNADIDFCIGKMNELSKGMIVMWWYVKMVEAKDYEAASRKGEDFCQQMAEQAFWTDQMFHYRDQRNGDADHPGDSERPRVRLAFSYYLSEWLSERADWHMAETAPE